MKYRNYKPKFQRVKLKKHSRIYKSLAVLAMLTLIIQSVYPIIPFLPSFHWLKRNVILANDDIAIAGEKEKVMYQNTNPEFKVEFGNKEQADKPFVRFQALSSGDNPFDKAKNEEIKNNIFERLSNALFEGKEHGIEFSMESAGTSRPEEEANRGGSVFQPVDPVKEITKNQKNNQLVESEKNPPSQNSNQNGNSNGNSNVNENTNENKNSNANKNDNLDNKLEKAVVANSNKNKNSSIKKSNIGTLIQNGNKVAPASAPVETSEKTKGNWEKDNSGDSTTPNQNTVQNNNALDRQALEVQAELQAEEQIYNQLKDQLDQLIKGETANTETMTSEQVADYREKLKNQILDQLTQEAQVKTSTDVAQEENPDDKVHQRDVIKNPDVVSGVDANYHIMEEKGLKEEIEIRNQEGFSTNCMQKVADQIKNPSSSQSQNFNCSLPKNSFTFSLKLDPGVEMHQAIGGTNQKPYGITYFTDESGRYLFHFLPLYAEDATGVRSNNVRLKIDPSRKEIGEDGSTTYEMKVVADLSWLMDPARQYPVRIDPSIVHDTKAEFDAGNALNRVESLSDPKVDIKNLTSQVDYGNGADGACSVTSGTTNLNTASCAGRGTADAVNFSVTANTPPGQNQVTLSTLPTGLAANDEILIVNLMGTGSNYSNVGKYETRRIVSISSNTLTLNSNLTNVYDGTTQKIMVQRVPNYTNVTVDNGTTLTTDAWNGTKNGVLFFRANGTVTINGTVDMNSKGFRGGANDTSGPEGYKGRTASGGGTGGGGGKGGLDGTSVYYYCNGEPTANGLCNGGNIGACCATTGGCNPTCYAWCAQGTSNICSSASAAGWGSGTTAGGGGGGGGTSLCGQSGGGTGGSKGGGGGGGARSGGGGGANGGAGDGNNLGGGGGGGGGASYSSQTNNTSLTSDLIQLGGGASAGAAGAGAGAGGQNGAGGGPGAAYSANTGNPGGGIVYISGFTINLANTVSANGGNGGAGTNGSGAAGAGGGGGGGGGGADGASGGTIILKGNSVTLGTITSSGGSGGAAGSGGGGWNGGNGGNGSAGSTGGNGIVGVYYRSTTSGTSSPVAAYYNLSGYRSAQYTSSVLDLTSGLTSIDSLQWTENGVQTGDGEAPYSSTGLVAQWNFNETSGTSAADSSGNVNTGTLSGFSNTTGQDVVAGSGWTANNGRWPKSSPKSLMFNGSSDYVNAGNGASLQITGALTVESWVNTSAATGVYRGIIGKMGTGGGQFGYLLREDLTGVAEFGISSTGSTYQNVLGKTNINDGKWHYLVGTYTPNTSLKIYVDGVLQNTNTTSIYAAIYNTPGSVSIGSTYTSAPQELFRGTIDSARIYSRVLTDSEILSNYQAGNIEFQTRTGTDNTPDDGSWEDWKPTTSESQLASMDSDKANWNADYGNSYTKLLIHSDGANNSTTFMDSSVNPHSVTPSGNAKVSTTQSKFGGSSAYFDGVGDYLSSPDSEDWNFGAGNFTIDLWVRPDNITGNKDMMSQRTASSYGSFTIYQAGANYLFYASSNGSSWDISNGQSLGTAAAGTWTHLAVVRSGSNFYCFQDGTQTSTWTSSANFYNDSNSLHMGSNAGTEDFAGYLDEVRISKGVARWTSNFTAPAAAYNLTDSGESLTWWTAKNDEANIKAEGAGSGKFTIGAPQVDGNATGLWHMDETGGSGAYIKDLTASANNGTPTGTTLVDGIFGKARSFNGSTDHIEAGTGSPCTMNSCTLEAWVKPSDVSPVGYIVAKGNDSVANSYAILISSSQAYIMVYAPGGSPVWAGSGAVLASNNWYHIAGVISGQNMYIYVNGALMGSNPFVGTITSSANSLWIGQQNRASYYYPFPGVIDEAKISNVARSSEEIMEDYRMGIGHRITKTIGSTDLSGKTKLPFYVAGDRVGSYLEATVGESDYANYLSDANTVGLWHLDEQNGSGAYIKDYSSYGNNGTPSGTTSVDGKIGKARSFNGSSDYISVPDNDSFTQANITVDEWVKFNSLGTNILFTGKNSEYWLAYNYPTAPLSDANKFGFGVYSGGTWAYASSATTPTVGQWYHVVGTYDGSNIRIYVNGVLEGGPTAKAAYSNGSNAFNIGGYSAASGYTINGVVDEARVSNVVRSASDIRQAYEVGRRTHPITIDFQAKLDAGNLIADSNDKSFTVDDINYVGGLDKASTLYIGDKVIVRENYNGTEYIAQGTVDSVNASTGAVTVSAWDAGSTFPSVGQTGFSANAQVFKWQREWMDLTGPISSQIDGTTRLTLRCTDGSLGENVYLDDFRAGGPYLTTPNATGNVSSTLNRYMQYRSIFSTTDSAVSPNISGVTVNYTAGPTNDQLMRHGKYFSSGVIQPFWWAK